MDYVLCLLRDHLEYIEWDMSQMDEELAAHRAVEVRHCIQLLEWYNHRKGMDLQQELKTFTFNQS